MSFGLSRLTSSHNAQLITTAVVSGVVVGTAILGFQTARRQLKVRNLKESIPDLADSPTNVGASGFLSRSVDFKHEIAYFELSFLTELL